jgi:hypothetical protein
MIKSKIYSTLKENLKDIDELLQLISTEQQKYQTAIHRNKPFAEAKKIYLRIKEYRKHLHLLLGEKRIRD